MTIAPHPHIELRYQPSYSSQLNLIERFWKLLKRRATHNRLFTTLSDLKHAVRQSLCYYQTMRSRIQSMIGRGYAALVGKLKAKATKLASG